MLRRQQHRSKHQTRKAAGTTAPSSANGPLFEALRWRAALAREQEVPAYVILHDRTLGELTAMRPATLDELLQVNGIGAAKRRLVTALRCSRSSAVRHTDCIEQSFLGADCKVCLWYDEMIDSSDSHCMLCRVCAGSREFRAAGDGHRHERAWDRNAGAALSNSVHPGRTRSQVQASGASDSESPREKVGWSQGLAVRTTGYMASRRRGVVHRVWPVILTGPLHPPLSPFAQEYPRVNR